MPNYQYCDALQTELSTAGVLTVTLNRPERLNAFDGELREAIYNMLADVRDDDNVRVLVLSGAGRAFCSGADLGAQDQRRWPSRPHEPRFMWCVDLLEMPKPTIAAIDGVAAGGGLGLALLCDIRICSDRARLIPIWNKRAIHPTIWSHGHCPSSSATAARLRGCTWLTISRWRMRRAPVW